MSYLVLVPPGEPWPEPPSPAGAPGDGSASPVQVFRIVSEPLAGKGRLRYMGCGPEGRRGLALQEKHVGEANRRFETLRRGDVVALEGVEPRGDGVALGAASRVTVLAEAGSPLRGPRGGD
jgi:hypothetical protein